MRSVSLTQAKITLSRLVEAIETGEEREIVITRYGRLVARLYRLMQCGLGRG
jgi:antitoxin (DNA-binding transcriptional repressor) of toxin-antitoxin stability system